MIPAIPAVIQTILFLFVFKEENPRLQNPVEFVEKQSTHSLSQTRISYLYTLNESDQGLEDTEKKVVVDSYKNLFSSTGKRVLMAA